MAFVRKNPLKLNKLQLRTLVLAQVIAKDPNSGKIDEATGEATLLRVPHAHGDHVHVGKFTVAARDASDVACPEEQASAEMIERIRQAKVDKDTVGGVAEVHVFGCPIGLGSFAQWHTRLAAVLKEGQHVSTQPHCTQPH